MQDIISSEISHLGWFDAESYGLSWKVRGYCNDESNPEIFDKVQVPLKTIIPGNDWPMFYPL